MNSLVTICARAGSKGIPGKNVKLLAGHPLISYSIKTAIKLKNEINCDLALSTDSDDIADIASKFGLTSSYRRPPHLATDEAGKIGVINDILEYEESLRNKQYDYIIDLDVTSPLRTIEDITSAFEILKSDSNAYNIFSVSKAHRNPYFNMVEQNPEGYFNVVKKLNQSVLSRQNAPAAYDMNASFYIYRRKFFTEKITSAITDKSLIYLIPHTCFDLDEPLDFEFLSFLISNQKLEFEL